MNFEYNEDQLNIKEMAKNFAETELMPYASEWDQNEIFPVETLKKAAELGLAAIYVNGTMEVQVSVGWTLLFASKNFLGDVCPLQLIYLSIIWLLG